MNEDERRIQMTEARKRSVRFDELREQNVPAFTARARIAVEILKSKGIEEYTLYVVNWSSVYKFHWQMYAFQEALMEELEDG